MSWLDAWNRHWHERCDLAGVDNLAAVLCTIARDPDLYALNCPSPIPGYRLTVNVWAHVDGEDGESIELEHVAFVTEGRDLTYHPEALGQWVAEHLDDELRKRGLT